MKRASETFCSTFFKQYRSFLCAAAVAAFAICLSSSSAFAATYTPIAVNCASGGNYQAPTSDPIVPTTSNPAELDANQNGPSGTWTVLCTWTYPSHVVTAAESPIYLHAVGSFGCSDKTGGGASISSSLGGWFSRCLSGPSSPNVTFLVPVGTNLDTISVAVRDSVTADSSGDANTGLEIDTLSIY